MCNAHFRGTGQAKWLCQLLLIFLLPLLLPPQNAFNGIHIPLLLLLLLYILMLAFQWRRPHIAGLEHSILERMLARPLVLNTAGTSRRELESGREKKMIENNDG
jgi:hypothetical protein